MPPVERDPLFTPRFWGMWAFGFVTFFSAFQLLPVIPFRILELGGTTAQAGWFLSVYTFASAFSAPVMGSLADHFGRRRTLITASLVFIVFSLAYGLITNLPLLLLVGAIHGSIWSSILASSSAILVNDFVPESRRTQGMAIAGLSSMSAIAVAPAVGLLVFHYGWFVLCAEMASLSVLMTFAALMLRTRDVPHDRKIVLGEVWDWNVTRTALTLAVTSIGYGGITSYAAILADQRHVTPKAIYLTTMAISIVIIRVFTSHLGDRLGYKVILYPALLSVPIAFVMLAFATTRMGFIASAVVFGAGFGSMYPSFAAFILDNTNPARRARTFGSIVWAFDTGIAVGSLLIGSIGQRWGLGSAFEVAAVVSCLALPIFMVTSRRMIQLNDPSSVIRHSSSE
jgi:MFS family permease